MHGATVMPVGIFENFVGFIENGDIRPLPAREFTINDIIRAEEEFLIKNTLEIL